MVNKRSKSISAKENEREVNAKEKNNSLINKIKVFFVNYWWQILVAVVSVILVASIGSLFIDADANWFVNLAKPEFYPPSWLFGVMWSIIYALIAVGLASVLIKGGNKKVYILYIINGVLQILWNIVFFGNGNLALGVIVLTFLVIVAYLLLKELYAINKFAFYFTLPYFVWLLFAFALNYGIYFLN